MSCFIIAALSADGYIARDPSVASTTWTSKEDTKRFIELTKKAGTIVVGLNTWQTFGGKPLKDRLNVIYSPEPIAGLPDNAEVTSLPPAELIKNLSDRGHKEVAICGGSQIYTMFMKSDLVDKLYLTIEPIVFGSGIRLFKEDVGGLKLNLISQIKTEKGSLLLEYDVIGSK